jgi:hypothetical protein
MKISQIIAETGSFSYPYQREPYSYSVDLKNWQRRLFILADELSGYFGKPVGGEKYSFVTDRGALYEVYLDDYLKSGLSIRFFYVSDTGKRKYNITSTGSGEEIRIISTVGTILRDHLETHKPGVVAFTAAKYRQEPSRIKLYNTIAKNFSRYFPQYKFQNNQEDKVGTTWFFTRKIEK